MTSTSDPRLGPDAAEDALQKPVVRPFYITGWPMNCWLMVDEAALDARTLRAWLRRARSFVETIPPK